MTASISAHGITKIYSIRTTDLQQYRTVREDVSAATRMVFSRRGNEKQDLVALRDVTFELEPGDVLGIVGENGAGKSTLLRVLAGITPPTRGEAFVRGRIGTMLEVGTGFHPELTGRENAFLAGAVLGMRRSDVARRFDEIVDYAGVATQIDEPLKHYSSGMQARLAFAVLAHLEPDILFVDEVLAVGDLDFQAKSFAHMKSLARRGVTVIFVSHNLLALSEICELGLYLSAGEVHAFGPISPVIGDYRKRLAQSSASNAAESEDGQPGALNATLLLNGVPLGRHVEVRQYQRLEFELRIDTPTPIYGVYMNLHLVTSDGRQAVHLRSDVDGPLMELAAGRHMLRLAVDELPLAPDTYLLSFRLVSGDQRSPLLWDSHAVLMELQGHNPLDTFVVPRHRFEHRRLDATQDQLKAEPEADAETARR